MPSRQDGPAPERAAWQVLRLGPCGGLADPLSGLLTDAGALGTWLDGDALVAYFPREAAREAVARKVAGWLGHLAHGDAAPVLAWEEIADGRWHLAWREHFRPTEVGRRLIVLPEWFPPEAAGDRLSVRIRPGEGFGTGSHPTTATCLEALERAVTTGASVLDVGTGSGILSIAAARLGAGRVVALDPSPDAIGNARTDLALNDLRDAVHLVRGGVEAVRGPFDLVLANLVANLIVALMPDLARVLGPQGRLVLSGLLTHQGDPVERALAAHGLAPTAYEARAGWLTLEASRPRGDNSP